mgnify:CR=1 FL=1
MRSQSANPTYSGALPSTTQRDPMINGNTELIAHIGYPTHSFKSPMIYNPYFEHVGVNAIVVPMGCQPADYPAFLKSVFTLTNIRGALITMPHKVVTVGLLDEVTPTVRVAGACNAVKRLPDGRLVGDQFDGAGFVRGVQRKGLQLAGARVLVVGSGGVGCAIAASLAGAGIAHISLFDVNTASAEGLGERIRANYPAIDVKTGSNDPAGYDLVVNASAVGLGNDDPLPCDVGRMEPHAALFDILLRNQPTPLVRAARSRGLHAQPGFEMLIQQMPFYLDYFGLPEAAQMVREDANFLRELIYPPALAAEITQPLRYPCTSVASVA